MREGEGEEGGKIFERWATLKETILRKNRATEQEDARNSGGNGRKGGVEGSQGEEGKKQTEERRDTRVRETLTASGAQRSGGRERRSKG